MAVRSTQGQNRAVRKGGGGVTLLKCNLVLLSCMKNSFKIYTKETINISFVTKRKL